MRTIAHCLGVLALLVSSAGTTASLNVTPANNFLIPGQVFTLTLTATGFVNPVGRITLDLAYDASKVTLLSTALPTGATDALRAATGTFLVNNNPTFDWLPGSEIPTGSFAMGTFTFQVKSDATGPVLLPAFSDDGGNMSGWFDANTADYIATTYSQTNFNICPSCPLPPLPQLPIPPAVWLFGSALGLMGWMRRKAAN